MKLNTSGSWRINATAGEALTIVGNNPPGLTRFPGGTFRTNLYNPNGSLAAEGVISSSGLFAGGTTRIPETGALTVAATGSYCLTASVTCGSFQCLNTDGELAVLRSSACTASLNLPVFPMIAATGGAATIGSTVSAGCTLPVTTPDWLTGPKTISAGTTQFTVSAGPWNGLERTGTVTVGGSSVTVTQFGSATAGCTYTLLTPTLSVPVSGGDGSVSLAIAGGAACQWSALQKDVWFTVFPLSGQSGPGNVSLTWVATPNFSTQPRTTSVSVAGQTLTVNQPGNTLSSSQRFVQLLYWSFFRRLPLTAEMNFQANSGLSRQVLAWNFWNSGEFFVGGRFSAGLYAGILNRDPEFGGWLWQRRALATKALTEEALVANFLNSLEYSLKFGTLTNDGFVRQMYRQVLFREPVQAEVDFQAGALAAGLSRTKLAQNFLGSAEFRVGVSGRLAASLLYFALLQRDPSVAERTAMQDLLASGGEVQTQLNSFINSEEFAASLQ